MGTNTKRRAKATRRSSTPTPLRALGLPLAFIVALATFGFLPQIRSNPVLVASFAAACAALFVWLVFLWSRVRATGRRLAVEVSLRPQHYLQAIAHTSIFVYWALYWDPIKDAAPLIAAQIVFAYAFDMLLAWSRRETYTLGFGPFPIIYSTNLFLRFRDDWFYLQFLMVAVGFLAKELIRWERDGRRTHIFNPSSFPLALFSLALIVTGTSDITWAEGIATLLILPPQIYLFIFLVALPGQFLFRVTTMTLPAVLTTYLFSELYLRATGTYFFIDSNVPIAVFLGMHLLFTDPSTSPRTELGRIIFGVLYGLSVVGLYALLQAIGAPTYYDKLLQVPIMNLLVKRIDRLAQSNWLAWLDPARIGAALAPRWRSLAYVSMWVITFGAMTAANGLGDSHPGHTVLFWEKACLEGRENACKPLAELQTRACRATSPWACNELGILLATGKATGDPPEQLFQRACGGGFRPACENSAKLAAGSATGNFRRGDPSARDYLSLLRGAKAPLPEMTPLDLYTRACHQGWMAGCGSLAGFYLRGEGLPAPDKPRAASLLQQACDGGHASSCSNLGMMYRQGDGLVQDTKRALSYLKRACDLGHSEACRWLAEEQKTGESR